MTKTTLKFNKLFYSFKSIDGALEEFKKLVKAEISSEGNYHIVTLTSKTEIDKEQLKGEFSNYCLGLSRKEIRPHNYWKFIDLNKEDA